MADKAILTQLAADIQQAVDAYDPKDISSRTRIQAALKTMYKLVQPPEISLIEQRFHTLKNVCKLAAIEMGLFKLLSDNEGKSLTAADLAVMSGYDQLFVARVMRMMSASGWAEETGYQTYTANAYTVCQSAPGEEGGFIISNDMIFPVASKMRQFLQQKKPCNMSETPSPYDYAMGESVWETLKKNSYWKKGFDDNMTHRNRLISVPWHLKYPIEQRIPSLQAGRTNAAAGASRTATKLVIVDIGGNQGVDLDRFAESFPHLDCDLILQDLPETLKGNPKHLDPRIRSMAYDFFTAQPIYGADIYYLKSVLHDWHDDASLKILSNTAKSMTANSRLLINEMVLADTNESLLRVEMDMLMLFLCNGMERTKLQWQELLAKVNPPLRIMDIWSVPGDEQSVIEACLA